MSDHDNSEYDQASPPSRLSTSRRRRQPHSPVVHATDDDPSLSQDIPPVGLQPTTVSASIEHHLHPQYPGDCGVLRLSEDNLVSQSFSSVFSCSSASGLADEDDENYVFGQEWAPDNMENDGYTFTDFDSIGNLFLASEKVGEMSSVTSSSSSDSLSSSASARYRSLEQQALAETLALPQHLSTHSTSVASAAADELGDEPPALLPLSSTQPNSHFATQLSTTTQSHSQTRHQSQLPQRPPQDPQRAVGGGTSHSSSPQVVAVGASYRSRTRHGHAGVKVGHGVKSEGGSGCGSAGEEAVHESELRSRDMGEETVPIVSDADGSNANDDVDNDGNRDADHGGDHAKGDMNDQGTVNVCGVSCVSGTGEGEDGNRRKSRKRKRGRGLHGDDDDSDYVDVNGSDDGSGVGNRNGVVDVDRAVGIDLSRDDASDELLGGRGAGVGGTKVDSIEKAQDKGREIGMGALREKHAPKGRKSEKKDTDVVELDSDEDIIVVGSDLSSFLTNSRVRESRKMRKEEDEGVIHGTLGKNPIQPSENVFSRLMRPKKAAPSSLQADSFVIEVPGSRVVSLGKQPTLSIGKKPQIPNSSFSGDIVDIASDDDSSTDIEVDDRSGGVVEGNDNAGAGAGLATGVSDMFARDGYGYEERASMVTDSNVVIVGNEDANSDVLDVNVERGTIGRDNEVVILDDDNIYTGHDKVAFYHSGKPKQTQSKGQSTSSRTSSVNAFSLLRRSREGGKSVNKHGNKGDGGSSVNIRVDRGEDASRYRGNNRTVNTGRRDAIDRERSPVQGIGANTDTTVDTDIELAIDDHTSTGAQASTGVDTHVGANVDVEEAVDVDATVSVGLEGDTEAKGKAEIEEGVEVEVDVQVDRCVVVHTDVSNSDNDNDNDGDVGNGSGGNDSNEITPVPTPPPSIDTITSHLKSSTPVSIAVPAMSASARPFPFPRPRSSSSSSSSVSLTGTAGTSHPLTTTVMSSLPGKNTQFPGKPFFPTKPPSIPSFSTVEAAASHGSPINFIEHMKKRQKFKNSSTHLPQSVVIGGSGWEISGVSSSFSAPSSTSPSPHTLTSVDVGVEAGLKMKTGGHGVSVRGDGVDGNRRGSVKVEASLEVETEVETAIETHTDIETEIQVEAEVQVDAEATTKLKADVNAKTVGIGMIGGVSDGGSGGRSTLSGISQQLWRKKQAAMAKAATAAAALCGVTADAAAVALFSDPALVSSSSSSACLTSTTTSTSSSSPVSSSCSSSSLSATCPACSIQVHADMLQTHLDLYCSGITGGYEVSQDTNQTLDSHKIPVTLGASHQPSSPTSASSSDVPVPVPDTSTSPLSTSIYCVAPPWATSLPHASSLPHPRSSAPSTIPTSTHAEVSPSLTPITSSPASASASTSTSSPVALTPLAFSLPPPPPPPSSSLLVLSSLALVPSCLTAPLLWTHTQRPTDAVLKRLLGIGNLGIGGDHGSGVGDVARSDGDDGFERGDVASGGIGDTGGSNGGGGCVPVVVMHAGAPVAYTSPLHLIPPPQHTHSHYTPSTLPPSTSTTSSTTSSTSSTSCSSSPYYSPSSSPLSYIQLPALATTATISSASSSTPSHSSSPAHVAVLPALLPSSSCVIVNMNEPPNTLTPSSVHTSIPTTMHTHTHMNTSSTSTPASAAVSSDSTLPATPAHLLIPMPSLASQTIQPHEAPATHAIHTSSFPSSSSAAISATSAKAPLSTLGLLSNLKKTHHIAEMINIYQNGPKTQLKTPVVMAYSPLVPLHGHAKSVFSPGKTHSEGSKDRNVGMDMPSNYVDILLLYRMYVYFSEKQRDFKKYQKLWTIRKVNDLASDHSATSSSPESKQSRSSQPDATSLRSTLMKKPPLGASPTSQSPHSPLRKKMRLDDPTVDEAATSTISTAATTASITTTTTSTAKASAEDHAANTISGSGAIITADTVAPGLATPATFTGMDANDAVNSTDNTSASTTATAAAGGGGSADVGIVCPASVTAGIATVPVPAVAATSTGTGGDTGNDNTTTNTPALIAFNADTGTGVGAGSGTGLGIDTDSDPNITNTAPSPPSFAQAITQALQTLDIPMKITHQNFPQFDNFPSPVNSQDSGKPHFFPNFSPLSLWPLLQPSCQSPSLSSLLSLYLSSLPWSTVVYSLPCVLRYSVYQHPTPLYTSTHKGAYATTVSGDSNGNGNIGNCGGGSGGGSGDYRDDPAFIYNISTQMVLQLFFGNPVDFKNPENNPIFPYYSPLKFHSSPFAFSPSFLKSLLQKCTRRSLPLIAAKAALSLCLSSGTGELARRIAIICVEDAIVHPCIEYICHLASLASKKEGKKERVSGKQGSFGTFPGKFAPFAQFQNKFSGKTEKPLEFADSQSCLRFHHIQELVTMASQIAECGVRDICDPYHAWGYVSILDGLRTSEGVLLTTLTSSTSLPSFSSSSSSLSSSSTPALASSLPTSAAGTSSFPTSSSPSGSLQRPPLLPTTSGCIAITNVILATSRAHSSHIHAALADVDRGSNRVGGLGECVSVDVEVKVEMHGVQRTEPRREERRKQSRERHSEQSGVNSGERRREEPKEKSRCVDMDMKEEGGEEEAKRDAMKADGRRGENAAEGEHPGEGAESREGRRSAEAKERGNASNSAGAEYLYEYIPPCTDDFCAIGCDGDNDNDGGVECTDDRSDDMDAYAGDGDEDSNATDAEAGSVSSTDVDAGTGASFGDITPKDAEDSGSSDLMTKKDGISHPIYPEKRNIPETCEVPMNMEVVMGMGCVSRPMLLLLRDLSILYQTCDRLQKKLDGIVDVIVNTADKCHHLLQSSSVRTNPNNGVSETSKNSESEVFSEDVSSILLKFDTIVHHYMEQLHVGDTTDNSTSVASSVSTSNSSSPAGAHSTLPPSTSWSSCPGLSSLALDPTITPLLHLTLRTDLSSQLGLSPTLASVVRGLLHRAALGGMKGDVLMCRHMAAVWAVRGAVDALVRTMTSFFLLWKRWETCVEFILDMRQYIIDISMQSTPSMRDTDSQFMDIPENWVFFPTHPSISPIYTFLNPKTSIIHAYFAYLRVLAPTLPFFIFAPDIRNMAFSGNRGFLLSGKRKFPDFNTIVANNQFNHEDILAAAFQTLKTGKLPSNVRNTVESSSNSGASDSSSFLSSISPSSGCFTSVDSTTITAATTVPATSDPISNGSSSAWTNPFLLADDHSHESSCGDRDAVDFANGTGAGAGDANDVSNVDRNGAEVDSGNHNDDSDDDMFSILSQLTDTDTKTDTIASTPGITTASTPVASTTVSTTTSTGNTTSNITFTTHPTPLHRHCHVCPRTNSWEDWLQYVWSGTSHGLALATISEAATTTTTTSTATTTIDTTASTSAAVSATASSAVPPIYDAVNTSGTNAPSDAGTTTAAMVAARPSSLATQAALPHPSSSVCVPWRVGKALADVVNNSDVQLTPRVIADASTSNATSSCSSPPLPQPTETLAAVPPSAAPIPSQASLLAPPYTTSISFTPAELMLVPSPRLLSLHTLSYMTDSDCLLAAVDNHCSDIITNTISETVSLLQVVTVIKDFMDISADFLALWPYFTKYMQSEAVVVPIQPNMECSSDVMPSMSASSSSSSCSSLSTSTSTHPRIDYTQLSTQLRPNTYVSISEAVTLLANLASTPEFWNSGKDEDVPDFSVNVHIPDFKNSPPESLLGRAMWRFRSAVTNKVDISNIYAPSPPLLWIGEINRWERIQYPEKTLSSGKSEDLRIESDVEFLEPTTVDVHAHIILGNTETAHDDGIATDRKEDNMDAQQKAQLLPPSLPHLPLVAPRLQLVCGTCGEPCILSTLALSSLQSSSSSNLSSSLIFLCQQCNAHYTPQHVTPLPSSSSSSCLWSFKKKLMEPTPTWAPEFPGYEHPDYVRCKSIIPDTKSSGSGFADLSSHSSSSSSGSSSLSITSSRVSPPSSNIHSISLQIPPITPLIPQTGKSDIISENRMKSWAVELENKLLRAIYEVACPLWDHFSRNLVRSRTRYG